MIIERKHQASILKDRSNVVNLFGSKPNNTDEYLELQSIYKVAMQGILKNLDQINLNFHQQTGRDLIHHMESRLKTPESIYNKLKRKGIEPSMKNAREVLTDIVGIRIICHYIDDIYTLAETLCSQKDIRLVRTRDYIKNPKPNGYRSLHIVVTIPVTVLGKTNIIPVEIQVRTIAMDFWASLEHQIHYKKTEYAPEPLLERLKSCADRIAQIDEEMQNINKEIGLYDLSQKKGNN